MTYLTDIYGEYILTGQYCDLGLNGHEMYTIQLETGEKPAVLGLDLIEYTPSRVLYGSEGKAVERAIEFYEAGGIVTLCWHWNAPEDYLTELWYRGFYTDATNIRLNKIMNGTDSNGYELLLRDIDAIAECLKELQDADVPVLWRPLHEASGGWFWWGAAGPEAYIELWKLMYDRLTNHHGLNNLIWLWNGQSADWYPGGEYVDIIGEDIYAGEHVYSPQTGKFTEILEYSGGEKMIVLSEIGTLFDPELAVRDNTMWGFYATWSGEFLLAGQGLNILSEKYTEKDMLTKMYAHEKTLSLGDLPDLKTYEIKQSTY
jgi:mannan endo-1,4-beta-mannosidase